MSEYVTVEVEIGDDLAIADLYVNQLLTDQKEERYENSIDGDNGSPIAQMLFAAVDGIQALVIRQDCLTIRRLPNVPWEAIIDDVRDALRDWFL